MEANVHLEILIGFHYTTATTYMPWIAMTIEGFKHPNLAAQFTPKTTTDMLFYFCTRDVPSADSAPFIVTIMLLSFF
jgi:hypothetical protein